MGSPLGSPGGPAESQGASQGGLQAARATVLLQKRAFPVDLWTQLQRQGGRTDGGPRGPVCGRSPSVWPAVRGPETIPCAAAAEHAWLCLVPICANVGNTYFGNGKLVNSEMTGNYTSLVLCVAASRVAAPELRAP